MEKLKKIGRLSPDRIGKIPIAKRGGNGSKRNGKWKIGREK